MGFRPMTEQEIKNFGIIPDGATRYKDKASFFKACEALAKKKVHYQAGADPIKGIYWAKEITQGEMILG